MQSSGEPNDEILALYSRDAIHVVDGTKSGNSSIASNSRTEQMKQPDQEYLFSVSLKLPSPLKCFILQNPPQGIKCR